MTTDAAEATAEATPETTAVTQVETKDGMIDFSPVTDDEASVQTETSDEEEAPAESEVDDHQVELDAEAEAADQARIDQLAEEKTAAKLKQAEADKKAKELKEKQHQTFTANIAAMDKLLDQVESWNPTDPNTGQPIQLNRPVFKNLLESLNLVGAQNEAERTLEAAASHLTESERAAFIEEHKAAGADMDRTAVIGVLIKRVVDEATKPLSSLDAAKAASPAIARELIKLRAAEYKAGKDAANPKIDNSAEGTSTSNVLDLATYQQRLKSGAPVDPAAVDAITRRYLEG